MRRIEDMALALRRAPYRESSLIVTLLTRNHGLLSVLAQGIRRSRRGDRAALAGFHTVRLYASSRSEGALLGLRSAEVARARPKITESGSAVAACQLLQEAAYRFFPMEDPQPALFTALQSAFDFLEKAGDPLTTAGVTLNRLVALSGYGWQLETCAGCGRSDSLTFLSIKRAQAVCQACGAPYAKRLFSLTPHLITAMLRRVAFEPAQAVLSPQEKWRLFGIGCASLEWHSGRLLSGRQTFNRMVSESAQEKYQ